MIMPRCDWWNPRHGRVWIALFVLAAIPASATEGQKYVGTEWTWFTDYAYWSADWSLDAEEDCELEVGLGMKVGEKKLGGTYRFSEHINFTTRGLGAIHVRAVSGYAPCLVRLGLGNAEAIPIYGDPSVLKGAIKDGRIVYDKIEKAIPVLPDTD
jgi:hypothetical protein